MRKVWEWVLYLRVGGVKVLVGGVEGVIRGACCLAVSIARRQEIWKGRGEAVGGWWGKARRREESRSNFLFIFPMLIIPAKHLFIRTKLEKLEVNNCFLVENFATKKLMKRFTEKYNSSLTNFSFVCRRENELFINTTFSCLNGASLHIYLRTRQLHLYKLLSTRD